MISAEITHLPISRLTFQGICNKLVIFRQAGFKSDPSAIFFYAVDTKRVTAEQKKINISICVFVHVHICQTNDLKRVTRNQFAVFTNVSDVIYSPLKSGQSTVFKKYFIGLKDEKCVGRQRSVNETIRGEFQSNTIVFWAQYGVLLFPLNRPQKRNSLAYISVKFGGIDLKLCMRVFVDIAYQLKKKLRQSERVTLASRNTFKNLWGYILYMY